MNRSDVYAQCPFYRTIHRKYRGGTIECSEGIGDGRLTLTFSATTAINLQFEKRCCEAYAKCPIYKLICEEKKYED